MKKTGLYADNEQEEEVIHITYYNDIDFVPHISLTMSLQEDGTKRGRSADGVEEKEMQPPAKKVR
jgi:hypothetical protein